MLNFYVEPGMEIDKVYEIISFRQNKWLQDYLNFNTQKRNPAKNNFEKTSLNLSKTHFMEKRLKM